MLFIQHNEYRINVEMIVAYKPAAGDNGILVYLQGGHELKWTFPNKDERNTILEKLDDRTGISESGTLGATKANI